MAKQEVAAAASSAVEQAPEQESTLVTRGDLAAFGKEIANGITAGFQATVRPKVTIGQYAAKHRRKVRLNKEVYQNGGMVRLENLTDAEVEWVNRIHRPGRYLDRKIEVILKNDDPDNVVMFLRYSDKTADHRLANKELFRNFEDLCKKIVLEQDVIEENERIREEKLARL